jgi:hypothetical protein
MSFRGFLPQILRKIRRKAKKGINIFETVKIEEPALKAPRSTASPPALKALWKLACGETTGTCTNNDSHSERVPPVRREQMRRTFRRGNFICVLSRDCITG